MSYIDPAPENFRVAYYNHPIEITFEATDLSHMHLISKYNKRVIFLLCVFGIYRKYAWVVPLKGKKGITIIDTFQTILDEHGYKPNKI